MYRSSPFRSTGTRLTLQVWSKVSGHLTEELKFQVPEGGASGGVVKVLPSTPSASLRDVPSGRASSTGRAGLRGGTLSSPQGGLKGRYLKVCKV